MKKKAETDSDEPEAEVKATPSGGGGGLFDDEDDLFSIASQKKTEPKKGAKLVHSSKQFSFKSLREIFKSFHFFSGAHRQD